MKKLSLLVILLSLISLPISAADKKPPKPGEVVQRFFKLKGDNAWLDSGLILKPGDRVTIKASGQVFFSNGQSHSGTTPDGYNRKAYEADFLLDDAAYCYDPEKNWNHAALIGKDDNGIFLIGKNSVITGKKGKLYLGINDCSLKTKFYNTGEFNITVKIARGK